MYNVICMYVAKTIICYDTHAWGRGMSRILINENQNKSDGSYQRPISVKEGSRSSAKGSQKARGEMKKIGQSCGAMVYPWIQYITIDSYRACHYAWFIFFF